MTNKVSWLSQPEFNRIRIKFPNDKKYLGKILDIICKISGTEKQITISGKFELSSM